MRAIVIGFVSLLAATASAQEKTQPFPIDTPMTMRAVEAACTGITLDARENPLWADYPLRIEFVGANGEYLADAQVTLSKGDEALAAVNCAAPWVLFKVMPGAYSVSAEIGGVTKTSRVTVGGPRQARVVFRFADGK